MCTPPLLRCSLLLCGFCLLAPEGQAGDMPFFLGSWRKTTMIDCSGYPPVTKEKCDAIARLDRESVFSFTADELIWQNGSQQERSPYASTLLEDGRVEIRSTNLNQTMIFFRKGAQLCTANDKGAPVCYDRVQPPDSTAPATGS